MNKSPLEPWIMNKIGCREISREIIESWQLEKLKENIGYVKSNSNFYKNKLKNISEDDIKSFRDFEKLPFTTSDELSRDSLHFLCISQKNIERIVSLDTSGTLGKPKRIYFTKEDQELTIDFFHYGMKCLVKKGDRVLILLPGKTVGSVGDLLQKGLNRMDVYSYIYDPYEKLEIAEIIENERISCIVGIPVSVLRIKRENEKLYNDNITRILLSTDYVPDTIIRELSSDKCKVYTHYGMTEMGLGGGVECEALNGCHMREADMYFEIIDIETGKNLPDGEYGEIVFTTLTRKGMPLIRYRTGDIGRFMDKPCICGTILKTMERVKGRIENITKLYDNKYINITDLDEILLKRKEILNYEVTLDDTMVIKLEMHKNNNLDSVKNILLNDLYENLNLDRNMIKIDFQVSDHIVTGNGRLKRKIFDNRRGTLHV